MMKSLCPEGHLFLSLSCLMLDLPRLMVLGGIRKLILLWKPTDQASTVFALHAACCLWYLQTQPLVRPKLPVALL